MTEINFSIFIIAGTVVFAMLVTAIIVFLFQIQKKNQTYLYEKQLMKTQFEQALLQTLKTISEEIHDNVGQVLSLVKLNLNTVGHLPDERAQAKITRTKELVSKAINDLRDLSRSLHGEKIGEIGLQDAIANELRIIQNTGQFETDIHQ